MTYINDLHLLKVKEKLKSDSAPMLNINIQHILSDMEYIVYLVICIGNCSCACSCLKLTEIIEIGTIYIFLSK